MITRRSRIVLAMRIVLTIIATMRTWTIRGFSLESESLVDETIAPTSTAPSLPLEHAASTTWRSLEGFAYSIAVGAFHAARQDGQLATHVVTDLASSSADLALWLMTHAQSNEAECVLRATVEDLEGVLAWAEGETRAACVEGLADAASELGFLLATQGRKDEAAALLARCQRALVLEISTHEAT